MKKLCSALFLVAALSGCASITTSGDTQVKVETVTLDGQAVDAADCSLMRAGVATPFKSPNTVPVPKAAGDAGIECKKDGMPDGKAILISRVGAATFGNVLIGGGVGIIVDQATGKAYNFPEWIRVVMGKTLTFDRADHKAGEPTAGKDPLAPAPAK
ncbi:MAG: hypothetical protein EAZ30_09135 [Betaproteobacteria bacterium]|nr:MAG: hypothetical protein EAZ30_09135 [Betaproteobacteria bacterium]